MIAIRITRRRFIQLECSYLCRNKEGTIFYVYAASAAAPFKTKANSPEQVEEFVDQFKGLTHQDFLLRCFSNDENPFGSSDNRTKQAKNFNI